MMLFHTSCRSPRLRLYRLWRWCRALLKCGEVRRLPRGPVARFRLVRQSAALAVRTYRCEWCRAQLHVDMDWEEGATPEPTATLR